MTNELLAKLQSFFEQYKDYVKHHKETKGFFSDTVHVWQESIYNIYLRNIETILKLLEKHKGSISGDVSAELDHLIYEASLQYIYGARETLLHEQAVTNVRFGYLNLELNHVRSGISAQHAQVQSLLANLKALLPLVFDNLPPPTCSWLTPEWQMARANILLYVSNKVNQGTQNPREQEQSKLMMLSGKNLGANHCRQNDFAPVTDATFDLIYEQGTQLKEAKEFYQRHTRAKL